MKHTVKSTQINYLVNFIFKMVWNRETLYHHYFSTLLYNMKSGRIGTEWNASVPGLW